MKTLHFFLTTRAKQCQNNANKSSYEYFSNFLFIEFLLILLFHFLFVLYNISPIKSEKKIYFI